MRSAILISFFGLLLLLAGCSSSSSSMMMTPTPTPTPSSPNPAPSPTPTPMPSPTPTPTAQSDSFLATWFFLVGRSVSPQGTITLDTTANNGAGNLQAFVESGNSNFILQFCPFPQSQNSSNCINATTFSSDAHNFANVNFTFPSKGTFAGIFVIIDSGGNQTEVASAGVTGMSYKSALLPAATITGGIGQTTGNSPGIGSVVANGTTAHVTLTGAFPNHTFTIAECPTCAPLGNLTTDAQGNGSADVSDLFGNNMFEGTAMFFVSDADGVEFVTAFRVE